MQKASHWHEGLDEFYRFQVEVVDTRYSRQIVVSVTVEVATQALRVVHVLRESVDLDVQIALSYYDARMRRRHSRTRRHRYLHQHVIAKRQIISLATYIEKL